MQLVDQIKVHTDAFLVAKIAKQQIQDFSGKVYQTFAYREQRKKTTGTPTACHPLEQMQVIMWRREAIMQQLCRAGHVLQRAVYAPENQSSASDLRNLQ